MRDLPQNFVLTATRGWQSSAVWTGSTKCELALPCRWQKFSVVLKHSLDRLLTDANNIWHNANPSHAWGRWRSICNGDRADDHTQWRCDNDIAPDVGDSGHRLGRTRRSVGKRRRELRPNGQRAHPILQRFKRNTTHPQGIKNHLRIVNFRSVDPGHSFAGCGNMVNLADERRNRCAR